MLALQAPLKLVILKETISLHVFRDSNLVIKSMQSEQLVHNITLQYLAQQLKDGSSHFIHILFTHIYRELDIEVATLSKVGLTMALGHLHVK